MRRILTATSSPSNKRTMKVLGALAALTTLGLAACGGAAEPDADIPEATTPVTEATEPDPAADKVFALTFSSRFTSDLDRARGYIEESTADMEDFDANGAAANMDRAAVMYGDVADEARDLPGADSTYGSAVLDNVLMCESAYNDSAAALRVLDPEAMEATSVQLHDCSDGWHVLAAMTDDLI